MKIKNLLYKTRSKTLAISLLIVGGGYYWGKHFFENYFKLRDEIDLNDDDVNDTLGV